MQFISEGLLGFDSFDSSFAWKKPTGYQYQRSRNPSFAASSRASKLGGARGYAAKKRGTKNGVCNLQITSRKTSLDTSGSK